MRDLVTYLPGGITLDLAADDYGHPDGVEIVRSLYGHISRSDPQLVCAEHGSSLYLQMRQVHAGSDERQLWGIHFNGDPSHRPSQMSSEHKRQTEYVVRAADEAGLRTATEVSLKTRVRPDAVVYGQLDVAFEVQRSQLTKSAAVGRTTKAINGGMATSVWLNDSLRGGLPGWFWAVPSLAMNKLPWDVVPPHRSVTATSGLREIVAKRCQFPDYSRCPKTKGRPCGRWHADSTPWLGMTVDDVVAQVPAGRIVPIRYLGREMILVSQRSRDLYEELIGRPAEIWTATTSRSVRGVEVDQSGRVECVSPTGESEAESFLIHPPPASSLTPISVGTSWAARNLGHLPGRCRGCGWHIKKQGHAPECITNTEGK